MQLIDQKTRRLSLGTIELCLFEPPVSIPINHANLIQNDGELTITLSEFPIKSKDRSNEPGFINQTALFGNAFIEDLRSQFLDDPFKKGDGIDFYVDAGRFFPDNSSCTKILIKAVTSDLEKIGKTSGGLPDLDSPIHSPVYGFRNEYRSPVFNPTTTIMITIMTLDATNGDVRVLGHSNINLFIHRFRREQPKDPEETDYVLNKGMFQLPIYCQEPYYKPPFSILSFKNLEQTPCATILVRIHKAAKAEDGITTLSIRNVPSSE